MSQLWDQMQAGALRAAVRALRMIGPVTASNLGGWVARTLGPHLRVSRIADQNLGRAMPELDGAARARIIRTVWDNLGRVACELPHLPDLVHAPEGAVWEVEGRENFEVVRRAGTPALFFSGHFANWEMLLPVAGQLGLPVCGFYRAASNQAVDAVIQSIRQTALGPDAQMFAKGSAGARASLASLARGQSLAMLIDQKMNDGIAVPFFGRAAMTAPALAQLALRFKTPILPAYVQRLGPARFRLVCEPPLTIVLTGQKAQDIYAITLAMNATVERWVRADPAAWLWLHRRWPEPDAPIG